MSYKIVNKGHIRIISGKWRGRKLPLVKSFGLRPTMDRVKETVFNWLSPYIEGAHCLDCFSGTGSLGLEALSRYAASATFLEVNTSVVFQLRKTIKKLNIMNGKVIQTNSMNWLLKKGKPFDIVFVDPPFCKNILKHTLCLLEKQGWLSEKALIYVESQSKDDNVLFRSISWSLQKKKNQEKLTIVCIVVD